MAIALNHCAELFRLFAKSEVDDTAVYTYRPTCGRATMAKQRKADCQAARA